MIWLRTSAGDTESELTIFPSYTYHWLSKLVGNFIFIVPVHEGELPGEECGGESPQLLLGGCWPNLRN